MPGVTVPLRWGLSVALIAIAACRTPDHEAAQSPSGPAAGPNRSAKIPMIRNVAGPDVDTTRTLHRIAFGSCLDQNKPQPVWGAIEAYDPQLFLMLGDNVYADAESVSSFADAYERLADSDGYRALRSTTPVLAVWDDHDFGRNDAGAEYPLKRQSQQIMLDFFGVPKDAPRRTHEGIYDAVVVGPVGQRVQIILLDTRYFRSRLYPIAPGSYRDVDEADATMLGPAQWAWLREQLETPAEVRLLVSSVQFVANEHPFERWGVFPRERARLLALIGETRAGGVIVLSGDRHRGELSRLSNSAAGYPLFDMTSSSLNRPSPDHEDNGTRVGALVTAANFGTIDLVWEGQAHVVLQLRDAAGRVQVEQTIPLDLLQPV